MSRTLEAACALAAAVHPQLGCAIRLLNDEQFSIEAAHSLDEADGQLLQRSCFLPLNEGFTALKACQNVGARPLVTAAAEPIGVVVLFTSPAVPAA